MAPTLKSFVPVLISLAAALPVPAFAQRLFVPAAVEKSARPPAIVQAPIAVHVLRGSLALGAGATLDAALPDGRTVSVRLDRLEEHSNNDLSWSGAVLDAARPDLRAFGTTGESGTYAEIQTPEGTWGIVPSMQGFDWLFDKNASTAALPPRERADDTRQPPPVAVEARPKTTCPTISSMPSPQTTIDILAVMAPDFVATHGGAAGAESRLNYLVSSMNAFNQASNVAITYRRVATMNASYPAANVPGDSDDAALNAITDGTGSFTNVATIRDFFGADLVALVRGPKTADGQSISGLAWLLGDGLGNLPAGHAPYAYSVLGDWAYPDAKLSAHELAHNVGNKHDRPNAGSGSGGSTDYAFGFYICGAGADPPCGQAGLNNAGTGFATIMAYEYPNVSKFSSPNLTCQGTQPGAISAPCGTPTEDVVRAMNCVRQNAAAFRTSGAANCANLLADADGDGIPDCLEAASGRVNGVKDNDVFTSAFLFTAQQFRDFTGREARADGLNFWINGLNAGTYTRSQAVDIFFNSSEVQTLATPVARLYFAYFLAVPDYGSLQYWIGRLRSGMSLYWISEAFTSTADFIARYGALDNTQFVAQAYYNVLGRGPDANELAYWKSRLDAAAVTRGAVIYSLSECAENRALSADKVYVTLMFADLLRRTPTSAGLSYWASRLAQPGGRALLVNAILGTSEYYHRFLP
jgi:hypothetical protein